MKQSIVAKNLAEDAATAEKHGWKFVTGRIRTVYKPLCGCIMGACAFAAFLDQCNGDVEIAKILFETDENLYLVARKRLGIGPAIQNHIYIGWDLIAAIPVGASAGWKKIGTELRNKFLLPRKWE